jgi:hypothetical protein
MDGSTSNPAAALSIPELEARITELAGHLNAANHRWLLLIADFDRRHGWSDSATQPCAHRLNWRCGIDMGAAREKLRVAHALEKLPKISDAMARGELSYSKVRALVRPDGRSFDSIAPGHAPAQRDWTRLVAAHREQGIVIDRHTATLL